MFFIDCENALHNLKVLNQEENKPKLESDRIYGHVYNNSPELLYSMC